MFEGSFLRAEINTENESSWRRGTRLEQASSSSQSASIIKIQKKAELVRSINVWSDPLWKQAVTSCGNEKFVTLKDGNFHFSHHSKSFSMKNSIFSFPSFSSCTWYNFIMKKKQREDWQKGKKAKRDEANETTKKNYVISPLIYQISGNEELFTTHKSSSSSALFFCFYM